MSPREVVLWRHGRTAWNAEGRFQGQTDVPLDATGLAQARAAAPYVAAFAPDAVLTSDLSRAAGTADAVGELLGVVPTPDRRLREAYLGNWQGLTREEAARAHPEEYAAWQRGRLRESSESPAELAARAVPAVLEPDVERLLVVTHGGTSRTVIARLIGLPQEQWAVLGPLGNCHWSHLRWADRGWRLVAHNAGGEVVPDDGAATSLDAEGAAAPVSAGTG